MTDNTRISLGNQDGDWIASDEISGIKHQRVKVQFGSDGSATDVDASNPLPVTQADATDLLYRYLDTVGNGTGTKNANGNYSGGATQFFIAPGAGVVFHIERMLISVGDTNGMTAQEYGNLGSALTNGVLVEKRQGASTTLIDLLDGVTLDTNASWGRVCYDVDIKSWGAGNELLVARWTFGKTGGALRLDGDNSERLTVILEDDLTGLLTHYFQIQGYTV